MESCDGLCIDSQSNKSRITLPPAHFWLMAQCIQTNAEKCVLCLLGGKLDGVGPVNNRPSTDKLHHFVRKKEIKLF